jgi:cellulose synthase operon protein C
MDAERARSVLAEAERSDRLAELPLVEQLAVLGTFDPERLGDGKEVTAVVRLLCRHLPAQGSRQEAILLDERRIDALAMMMARGGRPVLIKTRGSVQLSYDTPLQRMLDAFVLNRSVPVEARDEDELLASLEVYRWATEAVARAGLTVDVSTGPTRDEIESRLALLDVTRAVRTLDEGGCIGREHELARLHAYRAAPPTAWSLAEDPPMVMYGIGGVGKSTLVARFVMDLYREGQHGEPRAWAYLDLDRPTLSSYSADVVLADIIQQVGAQFPDRRRSFERGDIVSKQLGVGAGLEAADAAGSYRERASEFASTLRAFSNGSLVVVLDTYEELERNRPQMADELYGLFAALASALPSFKLIVSGRALAQAFLSERTDRLLRVLPLEDDDALELLRFFVVREAATVRAPATLDEELGREIIALVGGIPLTVRLAARVLAHEGANAVVDAAERAHALDRVRSEFVRGFLYQRILDHITVPDPAKTATLRRVARASIVLRRITVELVEQVLLPSTEPSPEFSAQELFDALASEVALADRHGRVLRLREELRGPALAALTFDDPRLVRRVHERAAHHYAAAAPGDATALLELTYHRLAKGDPVATVDAEFDDDTLLGLMPFVDLPPSAAGMIRRVIDDPYELSRSRDLETWERKILPEADAALRSGGLERARQLLTQRRERSYGTELHRIDSRLKQAEGNLDGAAVAARRDLHAAESVADAVRFAAAGVRLAALHELRGQPDEADAALEAAGNAPLLVGYPPLRLELLLNRMNTRERGRLDTEATRWSLGLGARVLIQRSDNIDGDTALLRLLAAALGRDEPERLEAAVRDIGLGREEDPRRVSELVAALTAWDVAQSPPGRLARGLHLRVDSEKRSAIERAWTSGVSGLGTDAGPLLGRLWDLEPPPEPVLEATRMIYLWWGVPTAPGRRTAAAPRRHFLADSPIDWARPEILQLEELVLTAYPTGTEARALADRAGLDLAAFSWSSSDRRITRELLGVASRMRRLDDLVEAVLNDPTAISVHASLRSLVGDAWLKERDLLA